MSRITMENFPAPDYFVQSEIERLRINIGFVGIEKHIIMITSTEPNEGKSYISTHLWNELAKAGKRVCFIDADMRKSILRSALGLKTENSEFLGLSHYLAGSAEAEDVIYSVDIPNVAIIPTITQINPSLLLESKRFDQLLSRLRNEYEYIIIDTPPLGLVSDGQLIATKCDGCVLVVRAHKTSRRRVRNSILQLQQVNCPLLGIVLNRIEGRRSKYYYSKYYSKGYYYGKDSNK